MKNINYDNLRFEKSNNNACLLNINYESELPSVSARDLHKGLEIGTEFRKWFPRMSEYGFTENLDWRRVSQKCPTLGGEQETVDYQISVDMAKQICMIQRSAKGKLYREYFLEIEKDWNSPEKVMGRALVMANQTLLQKEKIIRDQQIQINEHQEASVLITMLRTDLETLKIIDSILHAKTIEGTCDTNNNHFEQAFENMASQKAIQLAKSRQYKNYKSGFSEIYKGMTAKGVDWGNVKASASLINPSATSVLRQLSVLPQYHDIYFQVADELLDEARLA